MKVAKEYLESAARSTGWPRCRRAWSRSPHCLCALPLRSSSSDREWWITVERRQSGMPRMRAAPAPAPPTTSTHPANPQSKAQNETRAPRARWPRPAAIRETRGYCSFGGLAGDGGEGTEREWRLMREAAPAPERWDGLALKLELDSGVGRIVQGRVGFVRLPLLHVSIGRGRPSSGFITTCHGQVTALRFAPTRASFTRGESGG